MHCRAAPKVEVKDPIRRTHLDGHANSAATIPLPSPFPYLSLHPHCALDSVNEATKLWSCPISALAGQLASLCSTKIILNEYFWHSSLGQVQVLKLSPHLRSGPLMVPPKTRTRDM